MTLDELKQWIKSQGFPVGSSIRTTNTSGLGHRQGRAVDVPISRADWGRADVLIQRARALGLTVLDERVKPAGRAFRYWTGPNVHLEIPAAAAGAAGAAGGFAGATVEAVIGRTSAPAGWVRFLILGAALVLLTVALASLGGHKMPALKLPKRKRSLGREESDDAGDGEDGDEDEE